MFGVSYSWLVVSFGWLRKVHIGDELWFKLGPLCLVGGTAEPVWRLIVVVDVVGGCL